MAKMAKTVKIIKKAIATFFSHVQDLTNFKDSEKTNERFQRTSVTYGRTHVRTDVTPKVSNDFAERPRNNFFISSTKMQQARDAGSLD